MWKSFPNSVKSKNCDVYNLSWDDMYMKILTKSFRKDFLIGLC